MLCDSLGIEECLTYWVDTSVSEIIVWLYFWEHHDSGIDHVIITLIYFDWNMTQFDVKMA